MKKMTLFICLICSGLLIFLLYAAYPYSLGEKIEKMKLDSAPAGETPSVINVVTWNMAFAYGDGSEGNGYEFKEKSFFLHKLDRIAEVLRKEEADLVFLQEVDFDSARSHHMDQLSYLSLKTGLKYFSPIVSWKVNYVPFPYWPVSKQFGSMRSGGGVLSRFAITNSTHYLLEKPASKPWWYNLFYLYRYFQILNVAIGEKSYQVINVHLEAFDQKNRESQTKKLHEILKKDSSIQLVVGDFNTTPLNALKKSGFSNPNDDYENDSSLLFMKNTSFKEVIAPETYAQNEESFFTFPSNIPDRKLDHIFYQKPWTLLKAYVIKEGLSDLSDHLPLKAQFKVKDPEFIRD